MAGVVIIHALEDGAPAHALAEKLEVLGYEAATNLFPNGVLRERIEEAGVVVALWSPRSAARPDLVGEAAYAKGLGRLVHARMHNTPAPREFAQDPQIDLTGWKGDDYFPGWLNLQAAIEGVMSVAQEQERGRRRQQPRGTADFGDPLPSPKDALQQPYPTPYDSRGYGSWQYDPPRQPRHDQPRHDQPRHDQPRYDQPRFDQPRYDPPRYNQPSAGGASPARLAVIGLLAFIVVAGVGFGAYQTIQGGQNRAAAESTWASIDKTDPVALRAFVNGRPGPFRTQAESALENLEQSELNRARDSDSIEAYRRFLAGFPDSRHSAEVRGRIAMLRQDEAEAAMMIEEPPSIDDAVTPTEPPGALSPPTQPVGPPVDLGGPGGPVPLSPRGANPGDDLSEDEIRRALTGE